MQGLSKARCLLRDCARSHPRLCPRLKVKECAMNDKDWRKLALNEYSPDSRAAKGMCECSFYPRDVLRGYLCALGHRGFERHARDATRPPRGACFPEEHWHPTW
eukprot:5143484-Prymnesium_polylepis.2